MENSLENLIRYESATVAGIKAEEDPLTSLTAMRDFHSSIGDGDSYFVKEGLKKTQESLIHANQTGQKMTLANTGLPEDISVYTHKYEIAFGETEVSGLVEYLGDSCKIPEEAEQGLLEYENVKYKDLAEKVKAENTTKEEKEKISKVLMLISKLRESKLEGIYSKMKIKDVEETARQLYPKAGEENYQS